jgi:beta-lactamase class A
MKHLKKNYIIASIIVCIIPTTIFAQVDSLRVNVDKIVGNANGKIGVAIGRLDNDDTLTVNGHEQFPMQSVYKFPLALAVLHQVDEGALSLSQQIYIKKRDLRPKTWSPLRETYPDGDITLTLDGLLNYTVSESDNNGCDILFRLIGGPKVVDRYIHDLGITDIAIVATEEEMTKDWMIQYRNWSSPVSMMRLLRMFYQGKILSKKSGAYLLNLLEKTTTYPSRIKGLLPKGTIVAHKTGTSGTNKKGLTAATNDIGIITLPDNKQFVVVVYVSNSTDEGAVRDRIIATISKAAWDYYSAQ